MSAFGQKWYKKVVFKINFYIHRYIFWLPGYGLTKGHTHHHSIFSLPLFLFFLLIPLKQ